MKIIVEDKLDLFQNGNYIGTFSNMDYIGDYIFSSLSNEYYLHDLTKDKDFFTKIILDRDYSIVASKVIKGYE